MAGSGHQGRTLGSLIPVLLALLTCLPIGCNLSGPTAGYRLVEAFPDEGARLVAEASERGDVIGLKALAQRGAGLNAVGKGEITPLVWAVRQGNRGAFKALLDAGADPNFQPQGTRTAVAEAAMEKTTWFLEQAFLHGADANVVSLTKEKQTPIFDAITGGNIDAVRLLIRKGARLDVRTAFFEETPLIYASSGGNDAAAMVLLEAGADPKAATPNGHTFLWHVENVAPPPGSPEVAQRKVFVEYLKSKGLIGPGAR